MPTISVRPLIVFHGDWNETVHSSNPCAGCQCRDDALFSRSLSTAQNAYVICFSRCHFLTAWGLTIIVLISGISLFQPHDGASISGALMLSSHSMLKPTYVLYLEQSVVAIDNNRSERTIKPFEIGSEKPAIPQHS